MSQEVTNQRQLTFHGEGGKLFGIWIVNVLLTIITFGIYHFWGKVAIRKYTYQETELEGSRFDFHGTGKELFLGFLKAMLIFILAFAIIIAAGTLFPPLAGILYIAFLLLIVPFAIHGAVKYNTSRTSWRGIHFGYRGDRNELMKMYLPKALLTIVTLGIYGAWLAMDLRRYILGHIRFGSLKFEFTGVGKEYFLLNLKGYFLTIITFGIYSFWWIKDVMNYSIENSVVLQDDNRIYFCSNITGGAYFQLVFINFLMLIFSLGFAIPWVIVRTMNFMFENIIIEGELDVNAIEQTEEDYKDATGEDLTEMLDIGF